MPGSLLHDNIVRGKTSAERYLLTHVLEVLEVPVLVSIAEYKIEWPLQSRHKIVCVRKARINVRFNTRSFS